MIVYMLGLERWTKLHLPRGTPPWPKAKPPERLYQWRLVHRHGKGKRLATVLDTASPLTHLCFRHRYDDKSRWALVRVGPLAFWIVADPPKSYEALCRGTIRQVTRRAKAYMQMMESGAQ